MTPRPATGKTPRRTFRIPDDLWHDLQRQAEAEGTSVTAIAIKAMRAYLKDAK